MNGTVSFESVRRLCFQTSVKEGTKLDFFFLALFLILKKPGQPLASAEVSSTQFLILRLPAVNFGSQVAQTVFWQSCEPLDLWEAFLPPSLGTVNRSMTSPKLGKFWNLTFMHPGVVGPGKRHNPVGKKNLPRVKKDSDLGHDCKVLNESKVCSCGILSVVFYFWRRSWWFIGQSPARAVCGSCTLKRLPLVSPCARPPEAGVFKALPLGPEEAPSSRSAIYRGFLNGWSKQRQQRAL